MGEETSLKYYLSFIFLIWQEKIYLRDKNISHYFAFSPNMYPYILETHCLRTMRLNILDLKIIYVAVLLKTWKFKRKKNRFDGLFSLYLRGKRIKRKSILCNLNEVTDENVLQ